MDLDLKIISATDLKKFNLLTSKIHPYVVVSILGATKKTPVDDDGDRNPTWNHLLTFSVPIGHESDLVVMFQIRSRRSLAADKLIGEVCVPLRDFIESGSVSYQVKKPSGKGKGVLNLSYRLTGKVSGLAVSEDPVISYPTKLQATGNISGSAVSEDPVISYPMKPHAASLVYPTLEPEELYPPPWKPQLVTGYPAVEGYKYDVYPPPVAPAPMAVQTSYGYPLQSGYGCPTQMGHVYPGQAVCGYLGQAGCGYPGQAGYGYGQYGNGYGYCGTSCTMSTTNNVAPRMPYCFHR